MKTPFKILFTIILLLAISNVKAQSHDMSPGSTCKLIKTKVNSESHICPACEAKDKKEKEAKVAENKRRDDAIVAKAKAENDARQAAWKAKQLEDAKNAHSGEVYINGNTINITNQVTESKKEPKSVKQNYFHALSLNYQDDGNAYWLDRYFETNQSNGFIINTDTLFRQQFKKCIGIRHPSQLWSGRTYNEFNFPPNLGIVILNEEKNIPHTNSSGVHSKMYPISDLIDINGKRILNDNNITAILHFVDDYFILFKGAYFYGRDFHFDDALIYNYKTKETYPIHKTRDKVRAGGYIYKPDERPLILDKEISKAFTIVKSDDGEILYYININGGIKSKKL